MADGSSLQVFDLAKIAEALRIHKSVVEKRAKKESWRFTEQSVRGGRRRLYTLQSLPGDVQAALLLRLAPPPAPRERAEPAAWSTSQIEAAYARYDRAPAAQKDIAQQRHKALLAVEQLAPTEGLARAREIVAAQLQREGFRAASALSLWRWRQSLGTAPRQYWLGLLLPHYVGRTATADCSSEAWDAFKADYLRLEAPTAEACYRRLTRTGAASGWTIPSLKTLLRRVERELSPAAVVLARQGEEAMLRMFPAQERDHSVFAALEAVNADGHKFDVFVRFPCGTVTRPILVGWQDILSGKILARRVAMTETSDLVRLSFSDLVATYGIPAHAWLDNGRGFAAKMLTGGSPTRYRFKVKEEDPTGIFVALGIEVHWTTPYHGQSKPIERAWLDFCDNVSKHPAFAGAYTGNKPDAKPENYGSRAIPLAEFLRVLDEEIVAHNARDGRRSKVCAGRSFDAVFAESYATNIVRRATEEQRRALLLAAEAVTASRVNGSVELAGNRYWTEELSRHAGKKVVVRFDPDNLHSSVAVYTLDATFIADAPCQHAVGFADTNAGREHARARRAFARAQRDQLDAERRMSAAEVAAQLPAPLPPTLPSPVVVAPVFGARPPRPAAVPEPALRTGTDDAARNAKVDQYLQAIQRQQNERSGWRPGNDE